MKLSSDDVRGAGTLHQRQLVGPQVPPDRPAGPAGRSGSPGRQRRGRGRADGWPAGGHRLGDGGRLVGTPDSQNAATIVARSGCGCVQGGNSDPDQAGEQLQHRRGRGAGELPAAPVDEGDALRLRGLRPDPGGGDARRGGTGPTGVMPETWKVSGTWPLATALRISASAVRPSISPIPPSTR